jgi:pimeloyl-ACP methyl ester carboxylesterase
MEITINGVKTNYQVIGEGQPFLILHGWGSFSDRWAEITEQISANGFKVFVPDLPGFGKSDELTFAWNTNNYVNWVEGFVSALNLKNFYLLGHSFGGALACKIAIKHPQEIKKLFLISAASVRKYTIKKSLLRGVAGIAKLFSWMPGYLFFRKAVYKFLIKHSDYPYVEGLLKKTFKNVISEDLSQFIGFIRVPVTIIWGDKDKATPVGDAYYMNKKIKNSKLVIIPGAGHILNRECPQVLAEKILENV